MLIDENSEIVEFTAVSPIYERQEKGQKSNVVRVFRGEAEELKFLNAIFSLIEIRVRNMATRQSFKRLITDISVFEPIDGIRVYIISWDGTVQ